MKCFECGKGISESEGKEIDCNSLEPELLCIECYDKYSKHSGIEQ